MDKEKFIKGHPAEEFYRKFKELHALLDDQFKAQFNRSIPLTEELVDRWERATKLGFGKGTSIYDSAFVFGDVKVGEHCWIGPNTIIDGSGGLEIGAHCTISTGVHIYTHDNVKQTLSGGKLPIEYTPVKIGAQTYIGPQSIVAKGVSIGKQCVVAANSFVNSNLPDFAIAGGNPAKILGRVVADGDNFRFEY